MIDHERVVLSRGPRGNHQTPAGRPRTRAAGDADTFREKAAFLIWLPVGSAPRSQPKPKGGPIESLARRSTPLCSSH
jgi:hypothetical protein